jgi:hypothetical protein
MLDPTEQIRKIKVEVINSLVETDNIESERNRLEQCYGQVWNTEELSRDFEVIGFMAPYCVVIENKTRAKGSLMFQHYPRFYFNFVKDVK